MLTSFHKIGRCKSQPRIWLESSRLRHAGFHPKTPFTIREIPRGLLIVPGGNREVSSRKIAGTHRPIIEIFGSQIERALGDIDAIKAKTSFGSIEIRASIRAAAVLKSKNQKAPFRTLELFAGGGTLSDAVSQCEKLQLVAGAEIEAAYADAWANKHPQAELFMGDIRLIHPAELPRHDILLAGIPCTSHSTMGRAKKKLAGRPEEGDTGDLFAWVLATVAHRPPAACVFENVPSFGTSLAGSVLKTGLHHLGYHLEEAVIEPHQDWGEISDRRRWVLIATLQPGFKITPPQNPTKIAASDCIDLPNKDLDKSDAARIAKTIEGLRAHNARHAALGHGFAFTTITRESTKIPTIAKSYHKINTGPFVETPYGPRLLRLHEAEAIMGSHAGVDDYSTGIQIIGQGVQTRVWNHILSNLAEFLENPPKEPECIPAQTEQQELSLG